MTLAHDELRDRAEQFPDRRAIGVDGGPAMTYGEWDRSANAVARGLVGRGVAPGDRVVLLLTNAEACDFAVAYMACHRAGAVAVPVNPRFAARELAHVIADCGARLVVASSEADRVRTASTASVDDLREADDSPFAVAVDGANLAEILYTSGTSGAPRGVVSTHANIGRHSMRPLAGGGVMQFATPLATFTGVHGAMLTPLRLAATTVVLPRFDAARFADLIESERPMWLLMVPAHILALLESKVLEGRDVSSVKIVMFGGSATPPSAVLRLGELLPGAMLLNGYGLTEGGSSICVMPPGEAERRPGSVGRPMEGVELRVVDESGVEADIGQVGEIVLRVPGGERSYWGDPEASEAVWRDGWLHTGDLGRFDDDGFLYVVDRVKDVIIRGGYNVASAEVEAAIHEHPDVAECAVVGIEHATLGQDVAAVVRMVPGAEPLVTESLRNHLAERIADYKQPRVLLVVTEPLARNSAGKLDKQAIARAVLNLDP